MKKRSTPPLDLAMAAFAGASVAFAVFAMPQAPTGQTARLLLVAAAGALGFALAWRVLRWAGGRPGLRAVYSEPRRAHAHPDAAARRPILATLDLGEPLEVEADYPYFTPIDELEEAAALDDLERLDSRGSS